MSGFIKCNMEINFGDHEQFNTKSEVKVSNVDMNCTEFIQEVIYPCLIGIGYQEDNIKEVIRFED